MCHQKFMLLFIIALIQALQSSEDPDLLTSNKYSVQLPLAQIIKKSSATKKPDLYTTLNLKYDKAFINSLRALSSDQCPIQNCNSCNISDICTTCNQGFQLYQNTCVSGPSQKNNGQTETIIIMAFASIPVVIIFICCLIFIYLKKKTRKYANRRIYGDHIPTEMQLGLPPGAIALNRINHHSSNGEMLMSAASTLIVSEESFIQHFPVFPFCPELASETCTVCFEQFHSENLLRITPCKHIFHHDCLYAWLITNDQKRCPNDNKCLF